MLSQAGLVNNLNDGLAWGLFPLYFAAAGLSVGRIGVLAALYPAVWGLGQLVTGGLSDRIGRKWLIAGGMLDPGRRHRADRRHHRLRPWALGAALLGAGTAMVYPTLLAAIGDVAHPPGGPARSASTGCGATAGSRSARSSPASSPTCSASPPPSGPSPRSPPSPGSSSRSACTRPTPATPAAAAGGRSPAAPASAIAYPPAPPVTPLAGAMSGADALPWWSVAAPAHARRPGLQRCGATAAADIKYPVG